MTAEWKLIQGHCWVTAYKCNGAQLLSHLKLMMSIYYIICI